MIRLLLRLIASFTLACTLLIGATIAAGSTLPRGDEVLLSVNWVDARWNTGLRLMLVDLDRGLRAGLDRHLGDMQNIEYIAWSPDSRYLAFSGTQTIPDRDIYLLDMHSLRLYRQTHIGGNTVAPTWSPDGTRIAFSSNIEGVPSVFEITPTLDGEPDSPRLLVEMPDVRWLRGLHWSPDGSLLYSDDRLTGIFQFTPDSGQTSSLLNMPLAYFPSVSPDGERFGFFAPATQRSSITALFVAARDGSTIMRVPTSTQNISGRHAPVWSPDGSRIAFSALDPHNTSSVYKVIVYTTHITTGETEPLYDLPPSSGLNAMDWRPR